jgi:serine/threonine protein kinase
VAENGFPPKSMWPTMLPDIDEGFADLCSSMLQLDPKLRITAEDALNHPWIKGALPRLSSFATIRASPSGDSAHALPTRTTSNDSSGSGAGTAAGSEMDVDTDGAESGHIGAGAGHSTPSSLASPSGGSTGAGAGAGGAFGPSSTGASSAEEVVMSTGPLFEEKYDIVPNSRVGKSFSLVFKARRKESDTMSDEGMGAGAGAGAGAGGGSGASGNLVVKWYKLNQVVKEWNTSVVSTEELRRRALGLSHDHIATVLDVYEQVHDGLDSLLVVMDDAAGGPLSSWLVRAGQHALETSEEVQAAAKKNLANEPELAAFYTTPRLAATIVYQLLLALEYLHGKGLVHGDVRMYALLLDKATHLAGTVEFPTTASKTWLRARVKLDIADADAGEGGSGAGAGAGAGAGGRAPMRKDSSNASTSSTSSRRLERVVTTFGSVKSRFPHVKLSPVNPVRTAEALEFELGLNDKPEAQRLQPAVDIYGAGQLLERLLGGVPVEPPSVNNLEQVRARGVGGCGCGCGCG